MADGLTLSSISICVGGRRLLSIDRHIAPGEVLTVMGPSGSGKSSLLGFVTGTLPPAFRTEGRVCLDGRDISGLPTHRRRIGILFQDDLLFPHLSVAGNLGFGLAAGHRDRPQRIEGALSEIGMEGFGPRDPATLSGGQRARVALMRTLLSEPAALLLDEPFSRLDADRRARTRSMVFDTCRKRHLPVVMVTHDADDADAANGPVVKLE